MTTRLSELKPGQAAVICRLWDHPLSAKLTEMGCLPGEWIRVIRIAPPGDPMSIEILGYQLALRRTEAEVIEVDVRPGFPQIPLQPQLQKSPETASKQDPSKSHGIPKDVLPRQRSSDSAIYKTEQPLSNDKQEEPNE